MRSIFTGAKKCGGEKTHKGRSPTGFFRSPSRRKAAKQLQPCYVPVCVVSNDLYYIFLFHIFDYSCTAHCHTGSGYYSTSRPYCHSGFAYCSTDRARCHTGNAFEHTGCPYCHTSHAYYSTDTAYYHTDGSGR
jgi:hypothetical protein